MGAVLAISLVVLQALPVLAGVVHPVRASGMAPLGTGGESAAFEQAKRAALRQAVEEALGVLVTAQTRVQNFALIEDDILTHTEGYVRRFDVVEKGPAGAGAYQVTIDAEVELGALHRRLQALDLLIESAGNPYILCLGREVVEGEGGRSQAGKSVAAALAAAFRRASPHFNLAAPLEALPDEEALFADLGRAAEVGRRQGADVVVRAQAQVRPAPAVPIPFSGRTLQSTGIFSAVADMRIEALWTDTGELFASLMGSGRGADVQPGAAAARAIEEATAALADSLLAQLAEDWRERVYAGRLIRLSVRGSEAQVRLFERHFSERLGGVEKLYPRHYVDGVGVYDVRAVDTGFDLARALSDRGPEGLEVEVVQVTLNSMRLQLKQGP